MRRWATLAAAVALHAAGGAAPDPDTADLAPLIDTRVRDELADRRLPGAALAVVADGRIALLRGYGYADVEARRPVDPEKTSFLVGSVSKVVTWLCVLQLAETGRLDLHQDVNAYLRDVQVPATYPTPVKVAHLITHTAGFEERQLGVFVAARDDVQPLGQWLREAMPVRIRPPGEMSGYSNYGAALAGYAVECVSGLPFERYCQERVFTPLGMTRSTFAQPPPARCGADAARGCRSVRGSFRRGEEEWVQAIPAAALHTSASDMGKLMLSLLAKRSPVLGAEGLHLMRSRQFAHDARVAGWTYGLAQDVIGGQNVLWHNGGTRLFHAAMVLLPDLRAGWFVVFNGAAGGEANEAVTEAVLDRLAPSQRARPSAPLPGAGYRVRACAGEYEPSRANRSTLEKFGRPFRPTRVRAIGAGELLLCSGGTTRRFQETEPFVFDSVDGRGRLVFRRSDCRPMELYANSSPSAAGAKLRWCEGSLLHLGLLTFCLGVFLSLFPRRLASLARGPKTGSAASPATQWVLGLLCGLNVLYLVGLAWVLLRTVQRPFGYPALWWPLSYVPWVTAALAVGAVGLVAHGWTTRRGSLLTRVHESLVAVAGVLFSLLAWYWNLMA